MADKSLVKDVQITQVGAAHNCRGNRKHRLTKGEYRLTVKEGHKESNYCLVCGRKFIDNAITKLTEMRERLPG